MYFSLKVHFAIKAHSTAKYTLIVVGTKSAQKESFALKAHSAQNVHFALNTHMIVQSFLQVLRRTTEVI